MSAQTWSGARVRATGASGRVRCFVSACTLRRGRVYRSGCGRVCACVVTEHECVRTCMSVCALNYKPMDGGHQGRLRESLCSTGTVGYICILTTCRDVDTRGCLEGRRGEETSWNSCSHTITDTHTHTQTRTGQRPQTRVKTEDVDPGRVPSTFSDSVLRPYLCPAQENH